MFSRKVKNTIDSLIGSATKIEGDLHFKGGLRIDGHICGNVIADTESSSMLIISEQAIIDGEVRAAHVVVNGVINGPVISTELLELQPKARISGDVHYKTLEMLSGALVSGKLTHDAEQEHAVLKLAASNA
ncbi:bactofilin family protein [Undibacterium oligocarboniphilum]|uniref:Polymer-forming cytoskeletal protein n=1 Tax=Undibacterium oligocarboniphilum TaxID=666702 RepID=A0A850QJD5_9BURK|nr:polymer-forming cytoskeletal protein [Undibacterium oligocarboniphilum]MBC3869877.1 polymer-forming cytoskeletal protein [Undibacterium oligocarboniphilum]NVO77493.1 polymer-forming cytoskeletal protein [Undibacterium oligocarboniphilum]